MKAQSKFSPRPWGWSVSRERDRYTEIVFPTPVGMVRLSSNFFASSARFPHARGDGPYQDPKLTPATPFSPRPWGWSVLSFVRLFRIYVFPTPVGMVRPDTTTVTEQNSFPHARGDGPLAGYLVASSGGFSPRPWGWSSHGAKGGHGGLVFPTPVGMVRIAPSQIPAAPSFPHARGDGPHLRERCWLIALFSPRPWGWSVIAQGHSVLSPVFPTPVGMVRQSPWYQPCNRSFPHARGDGPHETTAPMVAAAFSPRPWGWSVLLQSRGPRHVVFPTPVGMVRMDAMNDCKRDSFPHARGDGPFPVASSSPSWEFSPRPWGWSGHRADDVTPSTVFPTPVGMVRSTSNQQKPQQSFPHARGDGPRMRCSPSHLLWFSPRPWGWSGDGFPHRPQGEVFPTPVGMVRGHCCTVGIRGGFPHARGDGPLISLYPRLAR